jgi:aryl-alcohol dehydrogenase-like predicted oxidoreductase
LRKLNFEFLRERPLEETIAIALRFVLSVPGVQTAIVGTTKPERAQENARLVEISRLSEKEYDAIRERWDGVAPKTWIGQP